jgi:hypothetical protein
MRIEMMGALLAAGMVALISSSATAQDAAPARGNAEIAREAFVARAVGRAEQRFTRMDLDGSGTLSREERAAYRHARREAWQARQAGAR